MGILLDILNVALPLGYGLAMVNYLVLLVRDDPFAQRTCTPFLTGVFATHLTFVLLRVWETQRYPIASLAEVLSFIALAVTGVYLYVERIRGNRATGVFVLGLVTSLQILAAGLLPHMEPAAPALLEIPLLAYHVMAAVLAYSAFVVGAVYGCMFVLLYRSLKQKRFGVLFDRLPSLDVTVGMAVGANTLGFALLSVAILLGALMSLQLFPQFYRDPKFLGTVAVWLVYGVGLWGYFRRDWRGVRSAVMTMVGFAVAVAAVLGPAALLPSFHSFGR